MLVRIKRAALTAGAILAGIVGGLALAALLNYLEES